MVITTITLESNRLYRIPSGAYVIKATIAQEALSLYKYTKHPVFLYSGGINTSEHVKDILKSIRKDSDPKHPPVARKVA